MHKSSIGDSSSLPLSSEVWSGAKNCGSNANGSVQVKCTNINGKPFEWIIVPCSTSLHSRATKVKSVDNFSSNISELNQVEERSKLFISKVVLKLVRSICIILVHLPSGLEIHDHK